jgi:hypothetical protein
MKSSLINKLGNPNRLTHLIDIFGVDFNFQINGKNNFKTNTGAFISIFYFLILISLFMTFGIDLYQRKRPKFSLNLNIGNYTEIKLSNNNFTYAFRIEDANGLLVDDESKIFTEIKYFKYKIENGVWVTHFDNILPNKWCKDLPFTREKENYFNISLQNWRCVDFDNITMGGNWDGDFVYGIYILTKHCSNDTLPHRQCSSKEEIEKFITPQSDKKILFYSDMSLEILPSMDDFKVPLKSNLINRYDILNMGLSKQKIQNFKFTSILNDVGWFFTELKNEMIITTDSIYVDFTLKEKWDQNILFTEMIYFGRKLETYYRSYTKIQEVVANIGGFAKFFYFLISYFYKMVARVYKNIFLFSYIPMFDSDRDTEGRMNFNVNISRSYEKNQEIFNNRENPPNDHQHPVCNNESNNVANHRLHINKKNRIITNFHTHNQKNKSIEIIFSKKNEEKNQINKIITLPKKLEHTNNSTNPKSKVLKQNKNKIKILNLGLRDYIKYKIFKFSHKDFKISNIFQNYEMYKNYFDKSLDIITYIKLVIEFKNLKRLILDKNERNSLLKLGNIDKKKSYDLVKNNSLFSQTGLT